MRPVDLLVIQLFLMFGLEFICIVVYGQLTRRYYKSRLHVGETVCRKCGYILKGITKPRCSECGERI